MIADPGSDRPLSDCRETDTSPARLAAASRPVKAMIAIGSAKARSPAVGWVHRLML